MMFYLIRDSLIKKSKRLFNFFLFSLVIFSSCSLENGRKPVCHVQLYTDEVVFFSSEKEISCLKIDGNEPCGKKEISVRQADLKNLDQPITYKVHNVKNQVICEGKFKIPKESMKFAVIADTSYGSGPLPKLVKIIVDFSPDMVFHVGDFQYDNRRDRWSKLFEYFAPLLSNSFFYLAAGNHEYDSERDAEILRKYFPHEGNFFFEWNGIRFWGINTFKNGWQSDFLRFVDFIGNDKPLIIFIHKPFVSLSRWEELGTMNEQVLEHVHDKMSLVFSGHDHLYGRVHMVFPQKTVQNIVTGGGGAHIYGCAKAKSRDFKIGKIPPFKAEVEKCIEEFNVTLCEIDKTKVQCRAVSSEGKEIDNFSVELR